MSEHVPVPVESVFGWCSTGPQGSKPDQYHRLCRTTYTDQFDVKHACSCPKHREEAAN